MLNKIIMVCIIVLVVAISYLAYDTYWVEHPSPVAKILKAKGGVTLRNTDANRSLQQGDLVYAGDLISTASKASTRLVFGDGTVIFVGAGSSVEIQAYDYDVQVKVATGRFKFIKGAIRVITGKIAMSRRLNIVDRANTTIGIRGTDVIVANLEKNTLDVLLIESKKSVTVTNKLGKQTLSPGQGTTVHKGDAPTVAKLWPDAKIERVFAMIAE